ncbi:MAG: LptF/LptG family permease, partial [Pirellulales bacterium]|nr:LptF/LptG family permease [Pirellulales bacterium]
VDQGLGLEQVLLLVPYVLPDALRFSIPATILFAASVTYGRLAGFNELVAIKSMGISPMTIVWPALVLAFLLSLSAVWLNDVAVSWGRQGVQRVILESVEEVAYGMLRSKKSYTNKKFSINVKRVEGRRLIYPTLTFQTSPDLPAATITAAWAELRSDVKANELKMVFHDAKADFGDGSVTWPDTYEHVIPLRKEDGVSGSSRPSEMAMREIPEGIRVTRLKQEQTNQELATRAAFQMTTGGFDDLADDQWKRDYKRLRKLDSHMARLNTEPHRRWASGFSCLCFVMVGVPWAIRLRNSDYLTSFFVCFLPILVIYYPLLAYGLGQAKGGDLPAYSVWLGNVILVIAGYWTLRKIVRN